MKKFLQIAVAIALTVLLLASIGWYLFIFDRNFTRDMLLQQARYHDLNGNNRISAFFYDLAYSHSGKDENVAIELANQYKESGNYTKAELTLSNAIHAGATSELYMALCRTYVEQDKLMDAVALLAGIPDAQIKAELDAKRPTAPVADHKPGFYSQYIKLNLSTSDGTILYSTNAEYPSIQSAPYDAPFTLPAGETMIYAISVDNDGLVSPLSIMGYTVGGVIEPAIFLDPNMEGCIRELLNISLDKIIYTNDLWTITEFTMPENVYALDDLVLMPFLEKLTITDKQITTLAPLVNLSKLQQLNLSGSRFAPSELAYISKLPELTELNLSGCALSTISDLEGANRLRILDLSNNTLRNLDTLVPMNELKEVYLQHNAVVGLESLSGLYQLEKLNLSSNAVESLAPLATCVKLSWLDASNNQIAQIEGLPSLPLLAALSLDYNRLIDLAPLGACTQLVELSISNNQITDLSALGNLNALEVLDFSYNSAAALPSWSNGSVLRIVDGSYNSVSDVAPLSGINSLSYVSLEYNSITSVNVLESCTNLVQLNVYGNKIDDVSALTAHNVIVNYDPT